MHRSGLNHRDCYLCHFLLDKSSLHEHTVRTICSDLHTCTNTKTSPLQDILLKIYRLALFCYGSSFNGRTSVVLFKHISQQPVHIVLPKQRKFLIDSIRSVKLYKKVHKKSPKFIA